MGLWICWLYPLWRGYTSPKKRCHLYNTKLYLMVMLQFWNSEEHEVSSSLLLLLSSIRSRVVIPVWIPFRSQMDLFKNHLYSIGTMGNPPHQFFFFINNYTRCPWCNGYCRRKWTRWHEFKSWTRLIAFHIALIPFGKGMNPIILSLAMGK